MEIEFMKGNMSRIVLIVFVACLFSACSTIKNTKQQEAAKAKLFAENIPYSIRTFMLEAEKGDVKHLKLFLEAGMDVDSHDNGTALTNAVYGNNLDAVKLLINRGADVNEAAYWGTPLGIASYKDYYKVAEFLIKNGANVNQVSRNDMTPLFNAVLMTGKTRIVELLLKCGADPNFKQEVTKETPLIVAAGKGYSEIVGLLIKGGSDVNYMDSGGLTALDWALLGDHVKTAEILLKNGASIQREGATDIPMTIALERKNFKFIELLLKYGVDVNGKYRKMPFVVWCAKQKFNDSVKFLIEHNANINAVDTAGNTALSYALEEKNTELIKIIKSSIASKKLKPPIKVYQKRS